MQDVFRLYAFALVLQLCIFIVYITAGQPFRPSSGTVMRQLANAAVHAAPPGLPACWLVAGAASRRSVTLLFAAAPDLIGTSYVCREGALSRRGASKAGFASYTCIVTMCACMHRLLCE